VFGCLASFSWAARLRSLALALFATGLVATPLAGQVTDSTAVPDTVQADTTQADTTGPVLLPRLPSHVIAGPLPIGSRIVFNADSLDWLDAETLADLLLRVPGAYIARGGSYGQPEVMMRGGRGARALEIYWDGLPLHPIGRDSIYADATRVPLAFLERVEVLYRPSGLRVDLVSRRHATRATRSVVRVQRVGTDGAGYRGLLLHRYASGLGLTVGADANDTPGTTPVGGFQGLDLWLRLEYLPRPGVGAAAQYWLAATERPGGQLPSGGTIVGRDFTNRYQQLTMFVDRTVDGRGLRIDGIVGSTSSSGDSGVEKNTLRHAALLGTYRQSTWSATGAVRFQSERAPTTVELGLGWTPLTPLTLAARLESAHYEGGRSGRHLLGSASLAMPLGFWLRGAVELGDAPQAPALLADTAQQTLDAGAFVGWRARWARLEAGLTRRDAYPPLPPPELDLIESLSPTPTSDYVTVQGSVSPLGGLTLGGWFEHPLTGGADFAPPYHGLATASFRSKFWRTFPSGAFDLHLAVQLESWSTGTAGINESGPIELRGASFINVLAQIEIAGFQLYWHMRNFTAVQETFVPGYPYGRAQQRFGALWTFDN